jgi:hypothetical protein
LQFFVFCEKISASLNFFSLSLRANNSQLVALYSPPIVITQQSCRRL